MGSDILAFCSHCSGNFQSILDYFTPNFKFKYENAENIKADPVNTVVSTDIKPDRRTFLGHPVDPLCYLDSL